MNITLIGVIIIIMSIYAFFKNEKLLLYMLIFFSTFTAAEIFHIDFISAPVLTYEFIGSVWLLREGINFIKSKPKFSKEAIINKLKENKLACAFIVFTFFVIFSEAFNLLSGMAIEYTETYGEPGVVKFSLSNISQLIIIVYTFILMTVLSFKIKTREEIKKLLKVFCISTIFAVIWGLLQFVTYYFGIPYPAFLFNNNAISLQCYPQVANNVKRICSIALEPSTFSINLANFIPFVLVAFLALKDKIKSKKYIITFGILVLSTICAILTTSSTSYVALLIEYGIVGLYVLFGFIKNGELKNRWKNVLKMAVVVIFSVILSTGISTVSIKIGYKLNNIEQIPTVTPTDPVVEEPEKPEYDSAIANMFNTLKDMTINKIKTMSGQERMGAEKVGLGIYQESPIVGIGFGSYRTLSMFTSVLISTGIFRFMFIPCYIRNSS